MLAEKEREREREACFEAVPFIKKKNTLNKTTSCLMKELKKNGGSGELPPPLPTGTGTAGLRLPVPVISYSLHTFTQRDYLSIVFF